jgi:uncharacterized membrane protein
MTRRSFSATHYAILPQDGKMANLVKFLLLFSPGFLMVFYKFESPKGLLVGCYAKERSKKTIFVFSNRIGGRVTIEPYPFTFGSSH